MAPVRLENQGFVKNNGIPLSIAVITRDRKQIFSNTIAHHSRLCEPHGIPIFVYDNGVKEDVRYACSQFPNVSYHKHDKDLSYDESFRYALTHTPGDYVWVISDRELICIGGEVIVLDWISRQKFAALIIGFGGRLSLLDGPSVSNNRSELFKALAWHTTLCGSTIYSRMLIDKVNMDKYMGKGFIHLAVLWDGLSQTKEDVLTIPFPILASEDDLYPRWLPRHIEVWCKEYMELLDLLPEFYSVQDKERVGRATGFNGALLGPDNFKFLANHGIFNRNVLDKYRKEILRITHLSESELQKIADLAWDGTADK